MFLYYIVRTLQTHIRKYMGTTNKRYPPHTPNEAPQESIDKFKNIQSENRRIHAAMVHEMDDAIGQIINALKEKNILNNTIIFFASDNGGLPPNLELNPGILNLPYKLGICDWERPLSFAVILMVQVVICRYLKEKCQYLREV